ncbi:MAG: peptidoglycan-binding protein [Desulfovibrio sp.]
MTKAKTLRNQGYALMREGRTADALDAYRDSLQFEDDETVKSIVRKLETQLAKEQSIPALPTATGAAPPQMQAAPSGPVGASLASGSTGDNTDQARQLRQQAFALSSQGRTAEAAELYRQSLQYEDSPQVRMILSRMEQAETRKAEQETRIRQRQALAQRHAPGMTTAQIRDAQWGLAALGYDPGPADGIMGEKSVAALLQFQADRGLAQDGMLNVSDAAKIQDATAAAAAPEPVPAQSPLATQGSITSIGGTDSAAGSTTDAASPAAPSQNTGLVPSVSTSQTTSSPAPATPSLSSSPATAASGSVAIPSDCEQAEAALTSEIERIMSQSESVGSCTTSKEYQRVMRESAALMRRCPQLDTADGAQAREYDHVAQETQMTIDASCP